MHLTVKETHNYHTIVIGAGQAGLSVGYFLKQQGRDFIILDANERVGDSWRERWDSLRLFTPARYDGLVGMPFPGPSHYFPTKDEMADYLEAYAERLQLPVRTGVRVERLSRQEDRFVVRSGDLRLEVSNVVVAMANYQSRSCLPCGRAGFQHRAAHSYEYRSPSQFQDGDC